jgi:hypothetical protein
LHMIKCSTPLSMISTIIFCTTWFFPRFLLAGFVYWWLQ